MTRTGILRMVNRYLTGATATGDTVPGSSVAGYTNQPNQYQGQLGAIEELSYAEAQKRSDPTDLVLTITISSVVYTGLQGGRFQYVQFAADSTNYVAGQVLYWKDETAYIVTNVAPSSVNARIAGFCVAPVTQGNYWIMQTAGVAWGKYRAAVTDTTADDGVYVLVNTNTIDAKADATADATAGVNKLFVGIAKDVPANSIVGRIFITNIVDVF